MILYRLFCKVTGKSYIGVTRQTLAARMCKHRNLAKGKGMQSMNLIARAIREHGWENFEASVVAHARSFDELMQMEKAAILLHRTRHPEGYNQLPGGVGNRYPTSTNKGRPAWNKGVPHSTGTKELLSAQRVGDKNNRARAIEFNGVEYACIKDCCEATGLTRVQVTRRIREGLGKFLTPGTPGRYGPRKRVKHTKKARQLMSEARSGAKHYRARAIEVDGKTYPSIKDAEGVSGYSRMQLKTRLADGRARYLTDSKFITSYLIDRKMKRKLSAHQPQARAFEVDGQIYPSIREAVRISGYTRGQLRWRLKTGQAKYLVEAKKLH